ncbi:MAG: acyl-[ACP]--phospholipid O-acyltransferase [Alphaproteobacteria bacterium]|nr:acyl-[ACP]--phospholipid O-acyltransferase [Alphaproteobacteria bacterium]
MNSFIRLSLRFFFFLFRITSKESAHLPALKPVVYISNHTSSLDILYLYAFLPKDPIFFLSKEMEKRKKFLRFFKIKNTYSFEPLNPTCAKDAISFIEQGKSLVIFIENRLSVTGHLMKCYETAGIIADKSNAPLVPVFIQNAEFSIFADTKGNKPVHLFPKITIHIDAPVAFHIDDDKRKNREHIVARLSKIMANTIFEGIFNPHETLFCHLQKTASLYKKAKELKYNVLEDASRKFLNYPRLICKIFIFGKLFSALTKPQEAIGILLPNSLMNVISFFGLSAYGRVPAMLNPTMGKASLLSVCKTASLQKIITSREFIETLKASDLIEAFLDKGMQVIYLETLAQDITLKEKLIAKLKSLVSYTPFKSYAQKRGCILFTSGSEGSPKAVVLSQSNMLANALQHASFERYSSLDVFFNALPMFHSFGLVTGTLSPLLNGSRLFLYSSPLHYRIIPELIYQIGATVMYSTDTFLKGYARNANIADFQTIRTLLGGAEAVKQDTRLIYSEKFGISLQEGYGATECAPILTINTSNLRKAGSIGQIIPGIDYKIKPLEGFQEGGLLEVKGPNIMMGYLYSKNTKELVAPENGWYSTGDVVKEDEEGFIFILDRVKRFAKIAGEMVSLTAVEKLAYSVGLKTDGIFEYGAVCVPHPTKGEQIVLVTNNRDLTQKDLLTFSKKKGITELYVPKTILYKEALPVLPTGKRDNKTLKNLVLQELHLEEDI